MNEKDIKKIAKILNKYYHNFTGDIEEEQERINNVIFDLLNDFADLFKLENSNFDKGVFQDEVLK